ncbi:hypothetical protein DSM106972_003690 [Dulcicalothrix desertica PCC 7102]|uniref:Uncharacterized protein n=1 Tax=Dulcicalothrix desertica PCC 7102 TaxID=232991 RepID=A0A433VUS8_9CYAN|nr:hypothetical protein DSM106972_003690 [Dulcicalothrix desertica PCC 7102]
MPAPQDRHKRDNFCGFAALFGIKLKHNEVVYISLSQLDILIISATLLEAICNKKHVLTEYGIVDYTFVWVTGFNNSCWTCG